MFERVHSEPPAAPMPTGTEAKIRLEISLAPMEGVTTLPMRLWFHLAGAPAVLSTPFLRVTPTFPLGGLPPRFAPELGDLRGCLPYQLIPQLMATGRDDFLRAAALLQKLTPFIDLNCGCPSPNCVGGGAGSSLLQSAERFAVLMEQLSAGVGPGALSVKMRTGFYGEEEFPALLNGVRALPLARLSVHGRTRPARYTGRANWELIAMAARTARAPVIASGDVVDAASLAACAAASGPVRGIMIGRGALRNPWIFLGLKPGTTETLELSPLTLQAALVAQALLHELEASAPERLDRLAKDFVFMESCGCDERRWVRLVETLSKALYGHQQSLATGDGATAWPVARATLGRLKMLWNYLRSSLPEPYFAPPLLRSPDVATLLAGLTAVHRAAGSPERLPLHYQSKLDWLYNGERRLGDPAAKELVAAETCEV